MGVRPTQLTENRKNRLAKLFRILTCQMCRPDTHALVEKAGSGTLDMIERCSEAGLPAPDFEERAGLFVSTLWRDWLTEEVLAGYNLNDRQKQAVKHAKVAGRINNAIYRDLTGISSSTALRELRQLTDLGIFAKVGDTRQSAHYVIAKTKSVTGKGGENTS